MYVIIIKLLNLRLEEGKIMLALREFEKVDGSGKIQTDIPKEFGYKVEY